MFREVVLQGAAYPVSREVQAALQSWIEVRPVENAGLVKRPEQEQGLHARESHAIILAQEVRAASLLMDEQKGVVYARRLGIKVVRTQIGRASCRERV